jgi:polar amino acid transport system substrate-binding protein
MKQLTQKLKNGQIKIKDVPVPIVRKGCLLVKNHYSLISPGTEASTVKTARKGYIGKAKDRPQQLQKVVKSLGTQGPVQTYRSVMNKLEGYSPLGYSSAGEVVEVASDVAEFGIGDLVACGGLSACHAEIISVPKNLCVKLRLHADLKQAAYNSLGAIALQGVRQAGLQLGESCAVIGLGLLGQLTTLLLKASGIRVVGIDIDPVAVNLAMKYSCDMALLRNDISIENKVLQFADEIGCDAVIITAATDSLDPINFAGAISRKKGTIVVVGAVPTGFEREPHYYQKELQVKMSCSYGPGRYDPNFEVKGLDYPPAYVRWTEKGNMQAFQELIHSKKIAIGYLTTHAFKLQDAPAAYDLILAKSEPCLGILIDYDVTRRIDFENRRISIKPPVSGHRPSIVRVGFIGVGSYAQSYLLPIIRKFDDVTLKGVMTTTGASSRSVGERFGFDFCTTNEKDIIENNDINSVFIATRHDSHAHYVLEALRAEKHVFVEKPLCIKIEELEEIKKSYEVSAKSHSLLMVGYNRRFSPLAKLIKEQLGDSPMAMTYRINAGPIPVDSWIHDEELGGGRIIGEVCHFVDFLTYVSGSLPISVFARSIKDSKGLNDSVSVILNYENGSIGNICYFANGDPSLPKERCEVYSNGSVAVLDDFKTLSIYANGKRKLKRKMIQDKGQKAEIARFIEAILKGPGEVISLEEIINTSKVTFKIKESIQLGKCILI